MVVTETLATEMWCPFARTRWANRRADDKKWQTTQGDGSFNRTTESFPKGPEYLVTKCVASECMAWRPQSSVRIGTRRVLDGLAGYKTVTLREETGFCGMAGAPVT